MIGRQKARVAKMVMSQNWATIGPLRPHKNGCGHPHLSTLILTKCPMWWDLGWRERKNVLMIMESHEDAAGAADDVIAVNDNDVKEEAEEAGMRC